MVEVLTLRLKQKYDAFKARLRAHPPEYAARAVAIGLFLAFTPTIAVQIPILIGIWLAIKRWFDFSLPIAISCTFVTNVFTFAPIYYGFLVTGRFLLGRTDEIRSFDFFRSRLSNTVPDQSSMPSDLFANMILMLEEFGLPLLLGSIPWAVLFSTLGYLFVWRLVRRRRA